MRLRAEGRKWWAWLWQSGLSRTRALFTAARARVAFVAPPRPQDEAHPSHDSNLVGPLDAAMLSVVCLAVVSLVRCKLAGGTRP
jgi:hypothetical protein